MYQMRAQVIPRQAFASKIQLRMEIFRLRSDDRAILMIDCGKRDIVNYNV